MFGWIKKVFAPVSQVTPEVTPEVEGVVCEITTTVHVREEVSDVVIEETVEEVVVEVTEPEYTVESLTKLTKLQLEALGREHGIELDRRKRKGTLVKELLEVLD